MTRVGGVQEIAMTIHELVTVLNTMEPEKEAFVAFFKTDETAELFDIEAVHDYNSHAQLEIYEEEEVSVEEGNGAVRLDATEETPDAADAAINAFLDFCERRGVTQAEKDVIWNAMAFICYEQVRERHGPFYEAIKPLVADDDA
jgi:hypothetical protein